MRNVRTNPFTSPLSDIGHRTSDIGYRISDIGYRLSNLLQLLEVMDIVPGQLLRDPLGRQRAVLGMREGPLPLRGREALEQRQVQTPQRQVRVERRRPVG